MPFFTIHTPTYNRAGYLYRLWEGLCHQTFKDFEWIVADDGSDDGTIELLHELKKKSLFPVTIISANKRVGKTVLDNHAIKLAKGEIFLWNDSDDILIPVALQVIYDAWIDIPLNERAGYCGVTALCETKGRTISTALPFRTPFDTTWLDLRYKYKIVGDMVYACRTDILIAHLPLEVDFLTAESSFWDPIAAKYKTRVIDRVVKKVEYNTPHCISSSGKIQYCRGYVYAMSIAWRALLNNSGDALTVIGIWQLITYFRYSIHGDLGIAKARSMLPFKLPFFKFAFVVPISFLLALKDYMQGKVVKTHLEFDSAIKSATFSIR